VRARPQERVDAAVRRCSRGRAAFHAEPSRPERAPREVTP